MRDRWQQQQEPPTITDQLGGHPEAFLENLPPEASERGRRRRLLDNVQRKMSEQKFSEQLQQRIDQELTEGEALVSNADLIYWEAITDPSMPSPPGRNPTECDRP